MSSWRSVRSSGFFKQRPAGVLERPRGVCLARVAQLVPVLAADLVQGLGGELHDVIVVDHDRRLRRVLTDPLRVAAGHVHRDRAELCGALDDLLLGLLLGGPCALDASPEARSGRPNGTMIAGAGSHDRLRRARRTSRRVELFKELIGGGLPLALGAPHNGTTAMITDECEVAMALAPSDLIDRDLEQIVQTTLVEQFVADALDDPPDRLPVDPRQPAGRGLIGLGRQPRDEVLEVAP